MKTFIDITVKDKNGKVIKHIHKKCHSYVRQFIEVLQLQMDQTSQTVRSTANAPTVQAPNAGAFRINAGATADTWGMQVGTGSNAVTISDYKLQTQIAHGNAATQLMYGAMSVGAVAIVGSSAQFTVARTYTNSSGAAITVNEVGIVCLQTGNYLLEHSLSTFTIANGASATVTYTIKVTV